MPFCELRYFSEALGFHTAANILLPDPKLDPPYHVMFLLHGLSDDHTIWSRRTSIERYADGLPLVIVMPNGGRGFYTDAHAGFAYGTAIGEELPAIVRRYFPVRDEWAITGLSMGGYGAVRLAFRYPKRFVSSVSHSGALGFGHTGERWIAEDDPRAAEFSRILGPTVGRNENDLYYLAQQLPESLRPKLRIDCGIDDFLIEHSRSFSAFLERIGYNHEYEEFPGEHNWEYWDEHVREALAFHARNLGFARAAG
jgi:S-formylglutathione hydrolase FrmB